MLHVLLYVCSTLCLPSAAHCLCAAVPCVVSRHLDADEATVLGAGLFAANLSTSFRLRKFGMNDMSMYGVVLNVDKINLASPAAADTEEVRPEAGRGAGGEEHRAPQSDLGQADWAGGGGHQRALQLAGPDA